MNKRTLAVFITTVILLLPCISAASTESTSLSESPDTAAVQTETETVYNVGQKADGTFGNTPESHSYLFNLPAKTQIAVFGHGAIISTLQIYRPDNSALVASIPVVSGGVYRYGVFTTPNISGNYIVQISGCCGNYTISCINGYQVLGNANSSYNRLNAASYAIRHHANPNPAYPVYNADCTNFVSQAVYAGGMPMRKGGDTDQYWYFTSRSDRSPSWTGADKFLRHWTKVRQSRFSFYGRAYSVRVYSKHYILHNKSALYDFISIGDTVHYLNTPDSTATHSQIFTNKISVNNIETCSHSDGFYKGNWFDYVEGQPDTSWIVVVKLSSN